MGQFLDNPKSIFDNMSNEEFENLLNEHGFKYTKVEEGKGGIVIKDNMKLKFTDWEIEKEFMEDFWGYDYRYYLEEITSENKLMYQGRILICSNNFEDIIQKIGELVLDDNKIEFIKSNSLSRYRDKLSKSL